MSNQLKLKNFGINSFGGISKNNPILVSFPEGHHFFKAEGDQGTNKTSTLEAIKALLGENLVPNAINSIDDNKNGFFRFVGKDGLLYQSKMTKTTFVLENIVTDAETGEPSLDDKNKERTREEKKPLTLIKKLVGPLGISPMELKSKGPAEQLEWLQSHYAEGGEDFKAKENELKTAAKNSYTTRTGVNREIKAAEAVLNNNDYFLRKAFWEAELKVLDKEAEVTAKLESKKLISEEYIRREEKVKTIKDDQEKNTTEITALEIEIKRLQDLLAVKNTTKETLANSLVEHEQYIETNKAVKEEYNELTTELKTIQERKVDKANFDNMLLKVSEKDAKVKESADLTQKYEQANKDLAAHIKSFTPDIPDFEVLVATEEDKKEGIFYQGKSIDQLCESELWEMCLLVWAKFDVRIVFVENLNSLGTNAIERLNWFAENGGYVFATEMDRAEKNIKITVNTKIVE